jgi:hypothetical protein
MRLFVISAALLLAGCGVAQRHPPQNLDPPAVEFSDSEGTRRWCTSPHYSEASYNSCRASLLADGYREIGPYCAQPEAHTMATNVALGALGGGVMGAVNAGRMQTAHAALRRECAARAQETAAR